MKLAEQIVQQLVEAGVERIYGVVGDSLNPIVDAVRRTGGSAKGGIDWVHVRHEEAGAFAASAEAQLTGKLAVCAGSCGPGNLHLINGPVSYTHLDVYKRQPRDRHGRLDRPDSGRCPRPRRTTA